MRNEAWTRWIEATQRNQVKNTSEQKLRTTIMGFALWFALLRKCKNVGPQFWGWKRELTVLKRFSHWNEEILTPLRPSTDWRGDPKQERRGRTPLERDLKENSRTG
jgi:hypothetical protein